MADYLMHTTGANERWDHIADKFYGDAKLIKPLLRANPTVVATSPIAIVLPKGTQLRIPILATADKTVQLPPWKTS